MKQNTPLIIAEYAVKPTFVAKVFNVKLKAEKTAQTIYVSDFFRIIYHGYRGIILIELDQDNLKLAIEQVVQLLQSKEFLLKHEQNFLLKILKWEFITTEEVSILESLKFKREGLSWILKN